MSVKTQFLYVTLCVRGFSVSLTLSLSFLSHSLPLFFFSLSLYLYQRRMTFLVCTLFSKQKHSAMPGIPESA